MYLGHVAYIRGLVNADGLSVCSMPHRYRHYDRTVLAKDENDRFMNDVQLRAALCFTERSCNIKL